MIRHFDQALHLLKNDRIKSNSIRRLFDGCGPRQVFERQVNSFSESRKTRITNPRNLNDGEYSFRLRTF
jgi:hypothetical protein